METVVFVGAQGKVAPPCVRGVISDVHAAGNDGISFYSAVCGRRNSLQEGFFDKQSAERLLPLRALLC